MKVLKKDDERIVYCDECDAKIQYEKEDLKYGEFGYPYIECPVCEEKIDLSEKEEDLKIDFENIEYPAHFYQFGTGVGAVEIENEQVNKWIKQTLNEIKDQDDGSYQMISSGNTMVFVTKTEGEYNVYVCPNYFNATIFKDDLDDKGEVKNQILRDSTQEKCDNCNKCECKNSTKITEDEILSMIKLFFKGE